MMLAICIMGIMGIIVFGCFWLNSYGNELIFGILTIVMIGIVVASIVIGCLYGFIPHRPSERMHTGIISAVDREGYFGNKYKIYLKTSQYTTQEDESVYKLYSYETELADEAKKLIGKTVVVKYSFEGGYISAWSAGE